MTQMLNVTHQTLGFGPVPGSRIRPLVRRSLIVSLAAGALISSAYAPAFADSTVAQGVEANIEVGSVISLTGLSDSFTLTGLPGTTSSTDTITYTVETNNFGGYSVSLTPQTPEMVGTGANGDRIPIEAITATDTSSPPNGGVEAISPTDPIIVHNSGFRSIEGGDELSTEFVAEIPFVNADTYTATLDYVATTL